VIIAFKIPACKAYAAVTTVLVFYGLMWFFLLLFLTVKCRDDCISTMYRPVLDLQSDQHLRGPHVAR